MWAILVRGNKKEPVQKVRMKEVAGKVVVIIGVAEHRGLRTNQVSFGDKPKRYLSVSGDEQIPRVMAIW